MKRPIRITTRRSPEGPSPQSSQLGGIYEPSIEQYRADQAAGQTSVPLDTEPTYRPEHRRKADTPITDADAPREIRMTAMHREHGEVPIHYQRDWQRLNPKEVAHDLIHLAVQNVVRENAGFIAEMVRAIQDPDAATGSDEWTLGARIEETIVDALERAGIREHKVTEYFWEYLEEEADRNDLPPELIDTFVTPERIGRICDEIDVLANELSDGATHTRFVP